MGVEQVLDLLGADVLALADDDVLEPPGQRHVSVGTHLAQVAGLEEPFFVERLARQLRIRVPAHHHRTAQPQLALLVGGGDLAVEADDLDLHPDDGLAVGVGELLVGVVRRTARDHRGLRHAVAVDGAAAADLALHLVVELRRLRRAATGREAQRRQDRLAGILALLGEERDVERGAAADHRDAVLPEHGERIGRRERLDQHGREPDGEDAHEVVGAADVRVRERDRPDVVARDVVRDGHAPAAGDQRLIGVLHALRIRSAPGRVVDPADGRLVGREPGRGRRERRGSPSGRPSSTTRMRGGASRSAVTRSASSR